MKKQRISSLLGQNDYYRQACGSSDIFLLDKQSDIVHLPDENVENKGTEKTNKYYDLREEYKNILNLKAVYTVPVVISAIGLVITRFKDEFKMIQIEDSGIMSKMQQSAIL